MLVAFKDRTCERGPGLRQLTEARVATALHCPRAKSYLAVGCLVALLMSTAPCLVSLLMSREVKHSETEELEEQRRDRNDGRGWSRV